MIPNLPLAHIIEWIQANEAALLWLAAASMFVFLATLFAIPWLVIRIPHDYFAHRKRRRPPLANSHPALRALMMAGKNILGAVFVAVGLAMLVLPGQGVMTVLVGILFLDLPGKYRFECWVARRGPVLRSLNWLRRRAGRPPMIVSPRSTSGARRGRRRT